MVAVCPVAVLVGDDCPLDCFVVAGAQVGEQRGVEVVAFVGLRGGDRGGGLAQHGDDLTGPVLPAAARRWVKRSTARATNPVETETPSSTSISCAVRSRGTLPWLANRIAAALIFGPIGHGAGRPERWCRGGGLAAAAAPPRQHVVGDFKPWSITG